MNGLSPLRWLVVSIALCITVPGWSTEELLSFATPAQRAFFETLTHEFRCLKCQNQTIADSKADLAADLRREIHTMVIAGKDRDEITDYLVQRYGDFVLYRPRLQTVTIFLWLGPTLLLLLALGAAWQFTRKRTGVTSDSGQTVRPAELEKARSLLNK